MTAYDSQAERYLRKAEAILDRIGSMHHNETRTALAAEAAVWVSMAEVRALLATGERR